MAAATLKSRTVSSLIATKPRPRSGWSRYVCCDYNRRTMGSRILGFGLVSFATATRMTFPEVHTPLARRYASDARRGEIIASAKVYLSLVSRRRPEYVTSTQFRKLPLTRWRFLDKLLPELPSAPPYPCPFLTDEDVQTYLLPLYPRGWTVQPSKTGDDNKRAPELVKAFAFENSSQLEEFLRKATDVTNAENVSLVSPLIRWFMDID